MPWLSMPGRPIRRKMVYLMPTSADVREIVMALCEVEERLTWESATFRVCGKIFALLHPTEQSVTVKSSKDEQAALLASDANTFAAAPYTGRFGWVRIRLTSIDADLLNELLVDAWRQVAPRRLTE